MINHISFQGRFVKDPELRNTPNNIKFSNFTLAWSEKYKDSENNCFVDCFAYKYNADFIVKYFKKGDMIIAEGKLITKKYENKNGNNKYTNNLIVDKVHFCNQSSIFGGENDDDDGLPF